MLLPQVSTTTECAAGKEEIIFKWHKNAKQDIPSCRTCMYITAWASAWAGRDTCSGHHSGCAVPVIQAAISAFWMVDVVSNSMKRWRKTFYSVWHVCTLLHVEWCMSDFRPTWSLPRSHWSPGQLALCSHSWNSAFGRLWSFKKQAVV